MGDRTRTGKAVLEGVIPVRNMHALPAQRPIGGILKRDRLRLLPPQTITRLNKG
jgi:hypothetical protein